MFKKLSLGILLFTTNLYADKITIAVAANVSYAIKELSTVFNKDYPHIKVNVVLGSSGKLTAQIKHGAPYDLFMSANMKYPNTLHQQNLTLNKPIVYAQGTLSLFSPKKKDIQKGIYLATDDSISRIAIANPKTAPYGKATFEAMKSAAIYKKVKHKFIYGESISQTVSYAVSATDIGFIATSSLYSPKMKNYKKGIHWEKINPQLYHPINQGIVILKQAEKRPEVQAFYDFILSKKAKKIFEIYGYIVPKEKANHE